MASADLVGAASSLQQPSNARTWSDEFNVISTSRRKRASTRITDLRVAKRRSAGQDLQGSTDSDFSENSIAIPTDEAIQPAARVAFRRFCGLGLRSIPQLRCPSA